MGYALDWQRNIFLIDDRSVDYEQLEQERHAQAEALGMDVGGPENGPAYDGYGTNLWIEIYGYDVTNQLALLTLHNTRSNFYYQLLSKTNLNVPEWTLGEVTPLNTDGTNQMFFSPVPTAGKPIQFFRGVEGFPMVAARQDLFPTDAVEPDSPTNNPVVGGIAISRDGAFDSAVTVVYRMSGTAIQGVDYTNLSGTVTIPAGVDFVHVPIHPFYDTESEFEEPVTLTVVLTNGYVVDPSRASATVNILDPPTNLFTVVVDNLIAPVGIDYHQPSNALIVAVNFAIGEPNNFVMITTNGVSTNSVITNWSGIHGLGHEIKLATVKTTGSGFTNGEMFFGTGVNGVIGWLSADGIVSNLNWITLTNETTETLFRGSFYVDQTDIFGSDLIAVTGGSAEEGGEVWRIHSPTNAIRLANMTNHIRPHLEGVITLTNDVQRWGPWAGRIITGAESAVDEGNHPRPLIHAINTNGVVTSFALGIAAEDFDIIPANQDLYCTDFTGSRILKLSKTFLANYAGDLLVTQEGLSPFSPRLFIVHWDSTNATFTARGISPPIGFQGFEHVTFAPISLPTISEP